MPTKREQSLSSSEKADLAILLRRKGMPYRAIGEILGYSEDHAASLVKRGARRERNAWLSGLSARVANALLSEGFESKEAVREAVAGGKIQIVKDAWKSGNYIRGLGEVGLKELREWLADTGAVTKQTKHRNGVFGWAIENEGAADKDGGAIAQAYCAMLAALGAIGRANEQRAIRGIGEMQVEQALTSAGNSLSDAMESLEGIIRQAMDSGK